MKTVLPEVEFFETDPEKIIGSYVSTYQEYAGRKLSQADPVYLFILAIADLHSQLAYKANDAAKQTLLYYSRDNVLDHKGYAWNNARLGNEHARTTIRFHLSEPLAVAKSIKAGTEITPDATLIFATLKDLVIQPGERYGDVAAECTLAGLIGNDIAPGQIDSLINPLPYVSKVENITETAGGTEREDDDSYRERIRQSPEQLSTAGPEGAYEYHAKTASAAILDVSVDTPEPGRIFIGVLLRNGELPTEEILEKVRTKLSSKKVRPLTDFVAVGSPEVIYYDLDIRYFISSEAEDKALIEQNVEEAIQKYIIWQRSKIGRDINPSRLISECIRAGAKRVEVPSPIFTTVTKGQVAHEQTVNIEFGGVEDD
ncbi:baseplate J/gp47 family protein [Sporosarcina sp. P33]|uniref:baseplate assembly protein n=1 Tax=Sporosarcina sp. P33 TaxID=1930764 RepID=UPI0009BDCF59|nr:baseplate J/gp47 family protein [Sporosarcina sp. P33]ARD47566.1 hypothetical protein SporoP33_04485 [Sporosarcina sp. P33]